MAGRDRTSTNGIAESDPYIRVIEHLLVYTNFLSSIAKQVIPTYITHSRPLIPDGIHQFSFMNEVWKEREARPMLIAKQESF